MSTKKSVLDDSSDNISGNKEFRVRVMIGFLVRGRVRIKIRLGLGFGLRLMLAFITGAIVGGANVVHSIKYVPICEDAENGQHLQDFIIKFVENRKLSVCYQKLINAILKLKATLMYNTKSCPSNDTLLIIHNY